LKGLANVTYNIVFVYVKDQVRRYAC